MRNTHYEPRRKKIHSPSVVGAMKTVRIDHKTQIMVLATVPDDVARERYLERINRNIRDKYIPTTPNLPIKDEFKELSVVDTDEIAEMIEDEQEVAEDTE